MNISKDRLSDLFCIYDKDSIVNHFRCVVAEKPSNMEHANTKVLNGKGVVTRSGVDTTYPRNHDWVTQVKK